MAHHRQKYNSGGLALRNGHAKRPTLKTRFSFANVTKSALRSAWPPDSIDVATAKIAGIAGVEQKSDGASLPRPSRTRDRRGGPRSRVGQSPKTPRALAWRRWLKLSTLIAEASLASFPAGGARGGAVRNPRSRRWRRPSTRRRARGLEPLRARAAPATGSGLWAAARHGILRPIFSAIIIRVGGGAGYE